MSGRWRVWLTWSDNVSQCVRSMRVTTRPGASGVPLWSSLHSTSDELRSPLILEVDVPRLSRYLVNATQSLAQAIIPARSVERSLRYSQARVGLDHSVSYTIHDGR